MMEANAESNTYTYVCIHLKTDCLSERCRIRLESKGVECLENGGRLTAYGIVTDPTRVMNSLQGDPDVLSVEAGDPPCAK